MKEGNKIEPSFKKLKEKKYNIPKNKEIKTADLGSHIICPFCKEKDKKIDKLKFKNKKLNLKLKYLKKIKEI